MLSEEMENHTKKIFIPDGYKAGGWLAVPTQVHEIMRSIFELAEVSLVNPYKKKTEKNNINS